MTPIRDYALIGNCETAALINPQGGIDWLCLPAFDAAPIFNRLLDDEKGGDFTLHPAGPFETTRRYLDDSAICETRFTTANGVVRLTDFFVVARDRRARFYDFTTLHETSRLVRLVEWESGAPLELEMRVRARPDYARERAHWKQQSVTAFAIEQATLFTNAPMQEEGGDLTATFRVERDRPFFAVLDYTSARRLPDIEQIRRWLRITTAFWHEWNLFNYYRGPHEKMVRRSAVTLKLLTYAHSGGFVAAPTTSLPEQVGGDANWDYRFTWLRDTALFIQTLFGLGYSGEAKAFLDFAVKQWMQRSEAAEENAPTIGVLYPVCDAPIPPETTLDHLAGFRDSKPVRLGNAAEDQLQLDNYGHVLQSLFFFRHTGGKIDADKRKMLERLTDEAVRFWREADNGVWEERSTSQYTHGKIMCWMALERARVLLGDPEGRLEKVGAEIKREVLARGLLEKNGRRELSAKMDAPFADASTMLAFTTGFLDEHVAVLTREGLEEKLARGPLLYRGEEKVGKEGAFLICSFWWINHLIREGRLERAEDLLEQMIALASPLGLYSEEIDPETGEFLGNFPQAFSHLGLIQSLLNLEAAKKKRGFYALPDHEKFQRSVGATIGLKGIIAGFLRVPRTAKLFVSRASKWRERET
ncbi:MAG: glycoside hydrolase family 15 protein [Chthoniobacterales bacterium]